MGSEQRLETISCWRPFHYLQRWLSSLLPLCWEFPAWSPFILLDAILRRKACPFSFWQWAERKLYFLWEIPHLCCVWSSPSTHGCHISLPRGHRGIYFLTKPLNLSKHVKSSSEGKLSRGKPKATCLAQGVCCEVSQCVLVEWVKWRRQETENRHSVGGKMEKQQLGPPGSWASLSKPFPSFSLVSPCLPAFPVTSL